MSKLLWDQTGERWYETGTSKAVIYPQDASGEYPHGVAWNGITGVTENPGGAEETALYADDIKYASLRSTETFGYTIEAYTYPEEFANCDGTAAPVTGVRIGQQKRKPFGFSYVTQIGNDTVSDEDDGYKIHLIYNSVASPSSKGYSTINESPDAITFSWEVTTTPVPCAGFKPVCSIVVDSTKFTTTEAKAKLDTLEDKLYGTDGTPGSDAYLPLPNEVLTTLGYVAPQG